MRTIPRDHMRSWTATWLSLAFVVLVLAALAVVPLLLHRRADAERVTLARLASEARRLALRTSNTLAVEVGADRGFQLTGAETFRRHFLSAWPRQQSALDSLKALAPQLGPLVSTATDSLQVAVAAWAALPLRTMRGAMEPGPGVQRVEVQQQLFQRTVDASTTLGTAVDAAVDRRRARAQRLAARAAAMTVALSALALLALFVVSYLAWKLRQIAQRERTIRKENDSLSAARERLVRGFSHDVKNPLGAASGFVALLESGAIREASGQADAFRRIRQNIEHALELINQLLDLARAEGGQLHVSAEPIDVARLVKDTAESYRAQADAAGLTLHVDVADVPRVRSDAALIGQVLGNLLTNASKYATVGGAVGLRVRRDRRRGNAANGPLVAIDVWDRGPGIPPAALDCIFDEFSRLQPDRAGGSGLGLAISRRIARALGGDLTVFSTPGEGACFTLWLPAHPGAPRGAPARVGGT